MSFVRRLFGIQIRSVILDVVIAGALGLSALAVLVEHWPSGLFGIGMSLAVLLRRRFPLQVFGVVAVLGLGQILIGDTVEPYDLAVMLALYSVVKYARGMRWAWLAAGVVVAGVVLESAVNNSAGVGGAHWPVAATLLVIGSAPFWLLGLVGRTRRLYVESLVDRAVAAERERDQRARLAVADERARIARELHDVVAHSLAVMIVQADGAGYAIETDPKVARDAVRTVASTGREALAEMRRLVSVLRNSEDGQQSPEPATGCPPARRTVGLGQLTPILDRFRASGLIVDLAVAGTAEPLPAGVELAGYRIVQESLTNTLKHAGAGSTVAVSVSYLDGQPDGKPDGRIIAVEIEVVDDGAGRSRFTAGRIPGGGHGLLGMRERVAVYGGDFAAGPRVGTGWQVRARIPVPVDDRPQLPEGPLTVEGGT